MRATSDSLTFQPSSHHTREMWRRPKPPVRVCVTHCRLRRHSAPFSSDESAIAASSALRQQLEFCCLVSGWDTPCVTCPFDWRGFDPKERHRILRRTPSAANDIEDAKLALGITGAGALSVGLVKSAFRRKALEWHPDCNQEPEAEERFREILDAYELLLAILSTP